MIDKDILPKNKYTPLTKVVGLANPRQAIQHILITDSPQWLPPIVVLLITSIARVQVAAGFQDTNSLPQTNNSFNFILPAIAIIVGTLAAWLVESELIHIILLLSGGRTSISKVKTITAWSFIPFIFRDIEQCIYMLLTKNTIVLPGLSALLNSAETFWERLLFYILAQIDIFFVWHVSVIIISTRIILPKMKISTLARVFFSVIIIVLLKGLIRIVTGSITS